MRVRFDQLKFLSRSVHVQIQARPVQGFSELGNHTRRRIFSRFCQHERGRSSSRVLA